MINNWVEYAVFWNNTEPEIDGNGTSYSLDEESCVVQIKRTFGFHREDWGEGNWTADDLR